MHRLACPDAPEVLHQIALLRSPGVGPREVFDISRDTIKFSLENRAILDFSKAKRAIF
jgi:hypothetical protein